MPFINPSELPRHEIFPGGFSGLVAGEHLMFSFLEMATGVVVPEHSHPHEQAGLILSGKLRFTIGEETRRVGPGDAFVIPPDTPHSGLVEEGPVRVLDVFSPVREDFVKRMECDK